MQSELISAPHTGNHTIFLSGPPGTGKTSLAVRRLDFLLQAGVPAEQILIMVPQRTLAGPYYKALHGADFPAGAAVEVATIGGLARRLLDLFWPLVAAKAGFAHPDHRPRFLTLETTQYFMDRVVEPFLASGLFDGVTISRARLGSQIIDNLNKSAAVGFPLEDIAFRLKGAWTGDSAHLQVYDQVQAVALAFRDACLQQNLLDWSLQIQVFQEHLLSLPQVRRYLLSGFRHLIADNIEEDIPAAHALLKVWLSQCESALLVHDTQGGYRVFLGADPQGALALAEHCRESVLFGESFVTTPEVAALGEGLTATTTLPPSTLARGRTALVYPVQSLRFHPQMLDWVTEEVSRLVFEEGIAAGEIAVLAPFLSDALRFTLSQKLDRHGLAVRTHRPSRELRAEPAAQCLLTLAKIAHPAWRRPPPRADVAQALKLSIADCDPVRARLLADIVYRIVAGKPALTPFHQIVPQTQQRISYLLGGRYDELWQWLQEYGNARVEHEAPVELDHFLSRLFGELLSQAGFGFQRDFDAGAVAANLIESVQKFRDAFPSYPIGVEGTGEQVALALEYVDMVERGVVAAQYISSWQVYPQDAVLLVPAYTFLMMNRPVEIQFWLDAGSASWFERIYQPLTHPYVLSQAWPQGQAWTDEDETQVREVALKRLILGLTRRCRSKIYMAYSELNERGFEQQGPLLQAAQRVLRARVEVAG
jgi:hypothetical protein